MTKDDDLIAAAYSDDVAVRNAAIAEIAEHGAVPELPERETDRKLHLTWLYESTMDTYFDQVKSRMDREGITFPEARSAMRIMVSDDLADSFEEWWGSDE